MFFFGVLLVVFSPAGPESGTFSATGFATLVAGRIVLGLAVGGASTVVPVFLAELSPYEIRGSITGRNEVAIVVGQLSAFVVNAILGVTLGNVDGVWRIMFAVCALPAVAMFFGMLRMPESPRRPVEKGKYDEALAVLKTVLPPRPRDGSTTWRKRTPMPYSVPASCCTEKALQTPVHCGRTR